MTSTLTPEQRKLLEYYIGGERYRFTLDAFKAAISASLATIDRLEAEVEALKNVACSIPMIDSAGKTVGRATASDVAKLVENYERREGMTERQMAQMVDEYREDLGERAALVEELFGKDCPIARAYRDAVGLAYRVLQKPLEDIANEEEAKRA